MKWYMTLWLEPWQGKSDSIFNTEEDKALKQKRNRVVLNAENNGTHFQHLSLFPHETVQRLELHKQKFLTHLDII